MTKTQFAAALLCLGLAMPSYAASAWNGTWKTDTASIKFPKKPDVYLLKGGRFACKSCVPPYTVATDGAFHPVAGNPYFDTMAVKIVDPRTITQTTRKGGKAMGSQTITVSADGTSLTSTFVDRSAPTGVPVTGKATQVRQGAPVPGAHAVSGEWLDSKVNVSDSGTAYTFKVVGDTLTFSMKTGQSYVARIDGPIAPVKGDPGWTGVQLKRTGPLTLVETDYRKSEPITVLTQTLSPDGKSMAVTIENKRRGTTTRMTAIKQ